jgi:hypothetical protein
VTSIIGICVTDAWKGYWHPFLHSKKDEELSINEFADRLACELIHNNSDGDNSVAKTLSPLFKKTPTPPKGRSPRKYCAHQSGSI